MNSIEINARMDALAGQRNEAENQCVILSGLLAVRDAEIERLKKETSDLKAKLEKPDERSRALPFSQEQLSKMAEAQQ